MHFAELEVGKQYSRAYLARELGGGVVDDAGRFLLPKGCNTVLIFLGGSNAVIPEGIWVERLGELKKMLPRFLPLHVFIRTSDISAS